MFFKCKVLSHLTSVIYMFSELSKWLEPLEKLHFDISGIPMLIDYIKQVSLSTTLKTFMAFWGVLDYREWVATCIAILCLIANQDIKCNDRLFRFQHEWDTFKKNYISCSKLENIHALIGLDHTGWQRHLIIVV